MCYHNLEYPIPDITPSGTPYHTLSYADALAKTASESIEAIVRKRRILFAGFVARMRERLPQRVMFGELVGGKGYSGGKGRTDWGI